MGSSAASLQAYVSAGGGLVTGAQAWYWSYTNPVAQHPSNLLLAAMGIYLSADIGQVGGWGGWPASLGCVQLW